MQPCFAPWRAGVRIRSTEPRARRPWDSLQDAGATDFERRLNRFHAWEVSWPQHFAILRLPDASIHAIPRICALTWNPFCHPNKKPLPLSVASYPTPPLGQVPIDSALAAALKQRFPLLAEDTEAHRAEHAAEVQLPFLQIRKPDCTFVPIALGTSRYEILDALGNAIAEAVRALGERVLLIASSDMNHYENDVVTRQKDYKAIERILVRDARGLFEVVMNENISMCGFGPTVAMLTAARRLGATGTELIKSAAFSAYAALKGPLPRRRSASGYSISSSVSSFFVSLAGGAAFSTGIRGGSNPKSVSCRRKFPGLVA